MKKILSKIPRNLMALLVAFSFHGMALAAALPSQVTGVNARIVNENSVSLSWDEATSEEGIIVGYKIYYGTKSVKNEGEVYEDEAEVAAQTSYPVENLTPGQTYYFAVTAMDDELNQSVNYSEEVSVDIPAVEVEDPVVEEPEVEAIEPVVEEIITEEPAKPAAPVDVTPPIDAQNLIVDKSNLKNKNSVSLRWQKSANLDGDVSDQIFYTKKGNGNWDKGYSIGKDLEEMVFDVDKDSNYEIKIVSVDTAGNISNEITTTFSTETLATSGPGMIIPLAAVAIVMFFYLSFRKKRS